MTPVLGSAVAHRGSFTTIDGGPFHLDSREIPCVMAADSVNGLNELPACRRACVARLNWLPEKERPPTSARTWPVDGSMATSAADGSVG